MCPAGLGEGPNWGTLPSQMEADVLLGFAYWNKVICKPRAGETVTEGIHYEFFNGFQPKTIIFHDATVAHRLDSLGSRGGTYITLSPSVYTGAGVVADEKPCADVDGIPTPPTPSPR